MERVALGNVVRVEKLLARVEAVEERDSEQVVRMKFPEGREEVVSGPAMILIEPGASVEVIDAGDGSPIYNWG